MYKDRAAERRSQMTGGENQVEAAAATAAASSSVNVAIGEENVGRKMLQKMGWRQGQGLGKNEAGITEPVIQLDI